MIAPSPPTPLDQWRQTLGGTRRSHTRPRPLAGLGYLVNGPVVEGLIEIEKLILVVLYDEPASKGCALRLAGYSGTRVPWGVRWGGPDQCRFFKNLLLQPVPEAKGLRLDTRSADLLRLGLELDRKVDRHVRYNDPPKRRHVALPKLWAGFKPCDAAAITGGGPELAAYAARTGECPECLVKRLRLDYFGLVLFPLAWVSHHWPQMLAVFADLERFPQRQVFPLRHLPGDLQGFQDAAAFAFYDSRFRPRRPQRHRKSRPAATVTA